MFEEDCCKITQNQKLGWTTGYTKKYRKQHVVGKSEKDKMA